MRKLKFLFGLAIFISEIAVAQKELNNWFFGKNAALNFGSGAPVFTPGSALVSPAGCSSISDNQGNLLFYSNGVTVWNRNHQPMPNGTGLDGDAGATQSVLITFHPGNANLYYVFTMDKAGGANGLRYSLVDMSLNGGLGDVDGTQKNVVFNLLGSEKIGAVKHRNGRDIWLVVPFANSNSFFVYLIDCTGLISFPYVFNVGGALNSAGYMKFSPDGKKLAVANFGDNFEILDFDNSNGVLSNPQLIPSALPGLNCGPYGVEFSPDSKLLYVTEAYTCKPSNTYDIYQFRLDPLISNTVASRVLLDAGNTNMAGALQLGPDNKIYIAYDGASYLGAINSPNTYGVACNLTKSILLQAPSASTLGLPNAIAGFKRNALGEDTTICGSSLTLKLDLPATTYLWSDGSVADSLLVTATGKYWVDMININPNGESCMISDTVNVVLRSLPTVNLGNDTSVCQGKFPLLLAPSVPGASFLWQDSSTNATFSASGQGLYWLQVSLGNCTARDSIDITSAIVTPFNLGTDTTICSGDSLSLTANVTAASYMWNTGETSKTIKAKAAGKYWCEATYAFGCSYTDSIEIFIKPSPLVNLGNDTILCQNQFPYQLNQSIPGASYLWPDGSSGNTFTINGSGVYWLRATLNGCTTTDSITVNSNPISTFNLGADTVVCTNKPLVLTVNPAFITYKWSNGNNTNTINVNTSGKYWCEVSNGNGCVSSDTINITINPQPVINLGNDTSVCQNALPLTIGQTVTGASYVWQDGSTNSTFSVTGSGTYWVKATINGCSASDTIVISAPPSSVFSLGADTTICSTAPYTLKANITAASYLWNTGANTQSITVSSSGKYWCKVNAGTACSFSDTIEITISSPVIFSLGKDTVICQNALPLTIGQTVTGASYVWQDGSTNSTFSVTGSGTYWVKATINGCSASDTIFITASPSSVFSLGADTTICSTGPYTLKANIAAGSYLWNSGANTQSITINSRGVYWCEINRGTGCSYSDTIKVEFAPPIVFSLGKDTLICQNTPLLLDVTNSGDTYSWQDNSKQPQYLVTKSGTYYVAVTKGGCTKSDSIVVTYGTQLLPDLGVDKSICPGESLLLDPNVTATSYLWQDGSTNRTFRVTQPGTYKVQVISQCGISTDEVIVSTGACKLMIPNAFAPGKGPNNTFRVLNAVDLKDFNLRVFNRWGQQVYSSFKATDGWDGRYKGIDQPSEAYIYTLSYTDAGSGKKISQKGIVMLVR
ncbi:MAG: gliding motility-associated C-terminal domain-containing protein [Chitinophagaceae bacterium]